MKVRVRARAAGPKARVGEGELGRPSQVEAIASLYLPLEKVKRVKPGSVMSIQLHYKRGVKRAPKKSTGDRTWDRLTSISKKTATARDHRLGAMLAIQSELLISHYRFLSTAATALAQDRPPTGLGGRAMQTEGYSLVTDSVRTKQEDAGAGPSAAPRRSRSLLRSRQLSFCAL